MTVDPNEERRLKDVIASEGNGYFNGCIQELAKKCQEVDLAEL